MSELRMASFRLTPETIERLRCLATLEHRSMAGQLEHLIAREHARLQPNATLLDRILARLDPQDTPTLRTPDSQERIRQ